MGKQFWKTYHKQIGATAGPGVQFDAIKAAALIFAFIVTIDILHTISESD